MNALGLSPRDRLEDVEVRNTAIVSWDLGPSDELGVGSPERPRLDTLLHVPSVQKRLALALLGADEAPNPPVRANRRRCIGEQTEDDARYTLQVLDRWDGGFTCCSNRPAQPSWPQEPLDPGETDAPCSNSCK